MVTNTSTSNYWGWLTVLGVILIIIGILAIAAPYVSTFASILVLGWLILFGGIAQLIFAFSTRAHNFFLAHSLMGLFAVLIGILMIVYPTTAMMTLTMIIAIFFLALGIFRIFSSVILRFENWGWFLFSGILALILGILILVHWPASALWVIGLFIGIDFIFTGWSLIMTSLVIRKVSQK